MQQQCYWDWHFFPSPSRVTREFNVLSLLGPFSERGRSSRGRVKWFGLQGWSIANMPCRLFFCGRTSRCERSLDVWGSAMRAYFAVFFLISYATGEGGLAASAAPDPGSHPTDLLLSGWSDTFPQGGQTYLTPLLKLKPLENLDDPPITGAVLAGLSSPFRHTLKYQ